MSSSSEAIATDDQTIDSQFSCDSNSGDDVLNLAYEPKIIKGRGGERLWHVEAMKQCATICKLQLTVIILK